MHVYPLAPFTQLPPFRHGELAQKLGADAVHSKYERTLPLQLVVLYPSTQYWFPAAM